MTDITIRIENDNLFHSIENVLKALKGIQILSIKKKKGELEWLLGMPSHD